jgi:hypothetical protein
LPRAWGSGLGRRIALLPDQYPFLVLVSCSLYYCNAIWLWRYQVPLYK